MHIVVANALVGRDHTKLDQSICDDLLDGVLPGEDT
jgi:hypothetical protein